MKITQMVTVNDPFIVYPKNKTKDLIVNHYSCSTPVQF